MGNTKKVTLTGLDYLILSIMLFFTLLGFVRGFIGELFSLISWVSASFITIIFQPSLSSIIFEKVDNHTISSFLGGGIIFVISIIMISIITTKLGGKITTKFPYSVNATLGTFFGFIKGFLISSLIFLMIVKLFVGDLEELNNDDKLGWIKNARTYNMLNFGAYFISPISNTLFNKIEEKYSTTYIKNVDQENNKLQRYKEQNNLIEKQDNINEKQQEIYNNKEENSSGYKKEQIEKLDYLIENL